MGSIDRPVRHRAVEVERLFPAGVVAVATHENGCERDLLPAELRCMSNAVAKRVNEFAAGRACARTALAYLGIQPTPILVADDRSPVWPSGVVGSISHTEGYCLAVVALKTQLAAVGVDAERQSTVCSSVSDLTMRLDERSGLSGLNEPDRLLLATLTFSAKEAFYKCQYALTRAWLEFEEVRVRFVGDSFCVSVEGHAHPASRLQKPWQGRFALSDCLVVTGIAAIRKHPGS